MRSFRRLAALLALAAAVFGVTGIVAAPAALAHPLGNFTVNHYSGLEIVPGHVRVTYVLDMAEIPTFQQKPAIDGNGDERITAAERAAWAAGEARRLLPSVRLAVDGRPERLSLPCAPSMAFRPGQAGLQILRLVATLDATVPTSGHLVYEDGTFADRIGWKEVTAHAGTGAMISGSTVPSRSVSGALLRYPTNLLSNPLDVTAAELSYSSSVPTGPAMACPSGRAGTPKAAGNSFASLVTWRLTPAVLVGSLLLAFAFGVLHALGPGHGKTITAAYLVGAGAKVRQAIGVGVAVSLMHTASVLALGLTAVALSSSFPSERIYPWLGVATGVVALSLGLALFVVRVRARRREEPWHGHAHPRDEPQAETERGVPGGVVEEVPVPAVAMAMSGHRHAVGREHGHDPGAPAEPAPGDSRPRAVHVHPHDHGPDEAGAAGERRGSVSPPRLVALAVSGGLLPSPTALVVLLGAISAHRVGYGLALIIAFSAGLATALIAIALLALRARTFVAARLGSRVAGVLPVLSALVIVGFGAFFLVRGLTQV